MCKFHDSEQGRLNAEFICGAMNSRWEVIARVKGLSSANEKVTG